MPCPPPAKVSEATDASSPLQLVGMPGGQRLAARIDAGPAALSVAVDRERVGQPFLQDHPNANVLDRNGGPGVIHVIAVVIFFLTLPALSGVMRLQNKFDKITKWYSIGCICALAGFLIVLQQYVVSEAIFWQRSW